MSRAKAKIIAIKLSIKSMTYDLIKTFSHVQENCLSYPPHNRDGLAGSTSCHQKSHNR